MDSLGENWSVLENNYFIKYHFFNMSWNISENFKDYIIAYEPNGGAIATISKQPTAQELVVYSASGKIIANKQWQDAPVIGLHWSENERVLLLQKSGRVAVYTLQCEYVNYVGMGDPVKLNLVKTFRFFFSLQGIGLMVITENNELYFKTNVAVIDAVIRTIKISKRLFSDSLISDWSVLVDSSDREVFAVIACKGELIKAKYNKEAEAYGDGRKWYEAGTSIVSLAVSQSQQMIAMARSKGRVWVLKSDLSLTIAGYNLDLKITDGGSVRMEWAGENLIVLYYDQNLYLMDINTQSTSIFYLDEPLLFAEIDGVRLITPTKHEFIQKIPHDLEQLCELGEDCPAAWLFDAQRHLENKSADAINYLEQVLRNDGQLQKAIDVCLSAACYCLEPKWQKTILHAVRLGRSYLPNYKSDQVSEIHNKLTLLNNLKLPFIAMPLTIAQLEHATLPVILDRLSNRQYFPFVERICRKLRIPKDQGINRMLEYWAENFIKRNENEDIVASKIIERLKNNTDFNYSKIADIACDMKKYTLAEKLLEKEGRVEQQVKILLKLKKNSLALTRSIESGNNDLISSVVSRLEKNMNNQEFFMLICKYPVAKTIYIEHLTVSESPDWVKSKRALDEMVGSGMKAENLLKSALKSESLQSALSMMIGVQDQYRKDNNDFMVQMIDDQKLLIQHQMTTFKDSEFDGTVISLHSYLSYLFDHNLDERADALKLKMKITDRQFYWLRMKSYANNDNWEEFDKLIQKWNRKMPISYYDIAEICADRDNEMQVSKYLDKVEPDKRVRILVKMNKLQEAEELAKMIKNDYLVHYVTAMKFNIG